MTQDFTDGNKDNDHNDTITRRRNVIAGTVVLALCGTILMYVVITYIDQSYAKFVVDYQLLTLIFPPVVAGSIIVGTVVWLGGGWFIILFTIIGLVVGAVCGFFLGLFGGLRLLNDEFSVIFFLTIFSGFAGSFLGAMAGAIGSAKYKSWQSGRTAA